MSVITKLYDSDICIRNMDTKQQRTRILRENSKQNDKTITKNSNHNTTPITDP